MSTPDPVATIVDQWHAALPDLDASPLLVLGRMSRIVGRVDPLLRPPFAEAGLAPGDFDVLAALRRSHPEALSPGALARTMLVTAGAATKRVERLETAGLVTRARSEDDGRGRLVALTPAGRRLTERLIRVHVANEDAALAALTATEREQLGRLLSKLLVSLEPSSPGRHTS